MKQSQGAGKAEDRSLCIFMILVLDCHTRIPLRPLQFQEAVHHKMGCFRA